MSIFPELNDAQDRSTPTVPAPETSNVTSPEADTADGEQTPRFRIRSARHAEAGRKGARRIHELIRQGRLYEQEHGLKSGRQRLRQLIEEGKRYEQEHGLHAGRRARRRLSREKLLANLLETLQRIAQPKYRSLLNQCVTALQASPELPSAPDSKSA